MATQTPNQTPQKQAGKTGSAQFKPFASLKNRMVKEAYQIENGDTVTIRKSPEQVFAFFRDFKNLSLFMANVKEVKSVSQKISQWILHDNAEGSTDWQTEIVEEQEGEFISWKSTESSAIQQRGTVWFEKAPRDMGTVVSLAIDYSVPGGKPAAMLLKFIGEDPKMNIKTNLRRLKAYLETGEIPTTEGQPSGRSEQADVPNECNNDTTKH